MNGHVIYSVFDEENGHSFVVATVEFELIFHGSAANLYKIVFADDLSVRDKLLTQLHDQNNITGVRAWLRTIQREYFDGITDDEINMIDSETEIISYADSVSTDEVKIRPLSVIAYAVSLFAALYIFVTELPDINILAGGGVLLLLFMSHFLLLDNNNRGE